jgi:3-oxoacyl-[acyl-carrier protein] reductase
LIEGTTMMPATTEDAARIPIGRFGTTSETADLAITMLTNGYLTGKVYLLDGGIHPH